MRRGWRVINYHLFVLDEEPLLRVCVALSPSVSIQDCSAGDMVSRRFTRHVVSNLRRRENKNDIFTRALIAEASSAECRSAASKGSEA